MAALRWSYEVARVAGCALAPMSKTMPTRVEALYGLRVATDLPLAGRPCEGEADITVVTAAPRRCAGPDDAGEVVGRLEVGDRVLTSVVRRGGGWSVLFHGVATAEIDGDLTEVEMRPDPCSDPGMLEVLAAGPVLAIVLALRGIACLHASAVAGSEGAVAFAGGSGAGKTTLAAVCCSEGAAFLCDDTLRLERQGDELAAVPGSRELRLRPGAAALADALSSRPRRVTADGRIAVLAGEEVQAPVPLRAVVVPRIGAGPVELRPIGGASAVQALLQAARVATLPIPSVTKAALDLAVAVAGAVPVFELVHPRVGVENLALPAQVHELAGFG